jgi:hypothetical protein
MNMRIVLGLLLALILFGCVSDSAETSGKTVQDSGVSDTGSADSPGQVDDNSMDKPDGPAGIIDVKDSDEIIDDKKDGPAATSQNDCSSLSPNCETCVAQEGCQWCKTSNACYYEGIIPTISSCNPGDWAEDELSCQGPPGGGNCAEQTNCVACLSGSGCKWCIQGSICADEASNEDCFGGWMEETFQCNYASR